jgi:hypothetical protein
MHSDLADRGRTSIYFKSSPYGSFNHSHADQNSFVIHAQGRVLAADSGYYDYYESPHWTNWYKQTRAHNAITFDGGQGQAIQRLDASGRVTHFETHEGYDVANGDATAAYGGALTRALRTIVYVRPGSLLVYDLLESRVPRSWEWNLHALSSFQAASDGRVEVAVDGVRLCARPLDGAAMDFSQREGFDTPPSGDYPRQWHGVWRVREKSSSAHFLFLLSVGCEQPETAVTQSGATVSVTLPGVRVSFDEQGRALVTK